MGTGHSVERKMMQTNFKTANLGYPRIGIQRELKKATESFWNGVLSRGELLKTAREIRAQNWKIQKAAGIDIIPSNDFSFYDQVLDMIVLLGAAPGRYGWRSGNVGLDTYFSMARGTQEKRGIGKASVPAMEMTKWFDTNYHYIVPEFHEGQTFKISSSKIFDEFKEALGLGIKTRPVLIGPVSFLLLGKEKDEVFGRLSLLGALLPVYVEIFKKLRDLGAESVQMDEPMLALDLDSRDQDAFQKAYAFLWKSNPGLEIMLATYFERIGDNLDFVVSLPVQGLHIDLVRAPEQLHEVDLKWPREKALSLGVINGRNIWKADLQKICADLKGIGSSGRKEYQIAPSCSLIHVPLDLDAETGLDAEIKSWLAFARQKLTEIVFVKKAFESGTKSIEAELKENQIAVRTRAKSFRIHDPKVKKRVASIQPWDFRRKSSFSGRQKIQKARLRLPLFPTTTIGSFPQTPDIRQARSQFKKGELTQAQYDRFLKEKIREAVAWQEKIGLDVLVHGEFERNDMVEYFGEQLKGFCFTHNGWVQSYGTRCVKPPVIFGDVSRPQPMTVSWSKFAAAQTKKPMKGMLTGPITILQWSFVRDDQPRSATAAQVAWAIRDEVADLEKAGLEIIQIDEPALREGLPLRRSDRKDYLDWAVKAFQIAASSVRDETQIHTHMCYSEFNDIIDSIAALDVDVITIECSRSQLELLSVFEKFRYPNEIGPGVYDIHSPQVPTVEGIAQLLQKAASLILPENLWVNPDCGLKTRGWHETELSLKSMVGAASRMRKLSSWNGSGSRPLSS